MTLQVGMSDHQVIKAFGSNPTQRNKVADLMAGFITNAKAFANNKDESWTYDFPEGKVKLYFENNQLTKWRFDEC